VPTDPRFDRKHQLAKPAQKSPAKKSAASQKSAAAASSRTHASSAQSAAQHGEKHKKQAPANRSGNTQERDPRKSREVSERRTEHTAKKPLSSAYEARAYTPSIPKKKKKKFTFKRFFKKLGKNLQAFGAKLIEVEEHPEEPMGYAQPLAAGDLGFAQKQPQFGTTKPTSTKSGKNEHGTAENILPKVKKALLTALRVAARGIYLGVRKVYAFLMKLPQRTLLIGSGAFGLVLITVVVLAIALPGKATKADQGEQLAAFTALETEQTALEAPTQDGVETGDTAPDGTVPSDVNAETVLPADQQVQNTTTEVVPTFTSEVKSGDKGAVITTIQSRLMELGYMDSDEPTQHFGPLTQSALKSFQRHNGLGEDGICGQSTYDMLMNAEAKVYVMQLGDSGPDVEGVQQRLYELGYLDNKANIQGVFGEKTETAAKEFQKKNDLKADGKVGSKTLEMLYGEDVVGNAFRLGDENQVIKDCQTALKKLGYITFKPDGVMGKATVSAIKAFQQANGLTRDGALGPVTRDLILSGKAQEMVMQLGDYGTDVKNMQARLAKLNYLSSANATGYFGEITEDAVKAFQKRAGLSADGKVGGVTLTMMNSSSAKKAASAPSTKKETKTSGKSSSGSSSSGSSGSSSGSVSDKSGVEKLIALAESKIGSKYVRGAKGPNSFDCSGFVYWCLKNSGVSTSYMTSIMWRSTSRFSRFTDMGSIQRGDILVFSGESDSAGHVGIYLGGGKMVDASSSEGQVRLSSSVLNSGGYWSRHFICAYHVF
jgi:peptidoglycan hydrolase-like protein with peptidoglycan-binding domain